MELRKFTVCRTCSELFPSSRVCPTCDGATLAAMEVQRTAALVVAADQLAFDATVHAATLQRRGESSGPHVSWMGALALTAAVGTVLLALLTYA